MIVYVETNFLLELAYLQERCESCQEILRLAQTRNITLVLPAFSAAEARATWQRRASERREFQATLQKTIRQLARSEPFRDLSDKSRDLVSALVAGAEEIRERLEVVTETVETHGVVLPLTADTLTSARRYESAYSLAPPDALVLASIASHAAAAGDEPKCFVSQDAKGFANPTIYDELAGYHCKVIVNFADALAHIRHAS